MLNRISISLIVAVAGYLIFAGTVIITMFYWRHEVLADMSSPETQAEWKDWRAKAAEQDGKHAPVQITVSTSPLPPALVLARDYFPACVIGLLAPLSALYAFIAWLIWGVLRQSNIVRRKAPRLDQISGGATPSGGPRSD